MLTSVLGALIKDIEMKIMYWEVRMKDFIKDKNCDVLDILVLFFNENKICVMLLHMLYFH